MMYVTCLNVQLGLLSASYSKAKSVFPLHFLQYTFLRFTISSWTFCCTCGWRWIKYEETVETGGRWSKPHVSTASLHSLFDLRSAIQRGTCVITFDLDLQARHHYQPPPTPTSDTAAECQTASLDQFAGTVNYLQFDISVVRCPPACGEQ